MDVEKREGLRLLNGLENGTLTASDAFNIADKRDPVIVYFVMRYLREKYPPTSPASLGVKQRLVELTSTYDGLVSKAKKGEKDCIREWFDDSYELKKFFDKPEELIDLLVDKIEG